MYIRESFRSLVVTSLGTSEGRIESCQTEVCFSFPFFFLSFLFCYRYNNCLSRKYNPLCIRMNLACMKLEMFTFRRVMFWIDSFFSIDEVKSNKKSARFPSS